MLDRRQLPRLISLLTLLLLISGVLGWRWWQREPLRRAHKAYSEARWLQSLSACQIYLARHPSHAEACRLAGRCAARLGLFQDADHYFRQAGGLLPDELSAHAEVLLKLRHWDRALVVYAANANSQTRPTGTKRTDLQRHDLSIPDWEAIQARVDLDPGAAFPKHRHPGEEIIYVL